MGPMIMIQIWHDLDHVAKILTIALITNKNLENSSQLYCTMGGHKQVLTPQLSVTKKNDNIISEQPLLFDSEPITVISPQSACPSLGRCLSSNAGDMDTGGVHLSQVTLPPLTPDYHTLTLPLLTPGYHTLTLGSGFRKIMPKSGFRKI